MKAPTRRKLEMGKSALGFSRAHPEATPGYAVLVATMDTLLARADVLTAQQRDGIAAERTATEQKRQLRRTLVLSHLSHLTGVAQVAAVENPDLPQKFTMRGATTYFAFRAAARGMAAEAQANKEVLEKHGMSEAVLNGLTLVLDQLDSAIEQSTSGRQAHVGASAELDQIAAEVVQVVKVMDGLNRARFAKDSDPLAAWESARNVVATPRPDPVSPAEVMPAA